MAAALGYADGSFLPMEVLEPALRRMVAVQVPITADIEAGYSRTTQETVDNVHQLIDTGIAGINIQDFPGKPQDDPKWELNQPGVPNGHGSLVWPRARLPFYSVSFIILRASEPSNHGEKPARPKFPGVRDSHLTD